ncbi:MAG: hypothetical protein HZC24_00110 [Rhodocyclales bacterium]|nr:hypothetical protein [Rhodocyclales bacterium]
MRPIDLYAIEREARELRAAEMRRLEHICAERARVYAKLLGGSLLSLLKILSEALRPLFSWVPNKHRSC